MVWEARRAPFEILVSVQSTKIKFLVFVLVSTRLCVHSETWVHGHGVERGTQISHSCFKVSKTTNIYKIMHIRKSLFGSNLTDKYLSGQLTEIAWKLAQLKDLSSQKESMSLSTITEFTWIQTTGDLRTPMNSFQRGK